MDRYIVYFNGTLGKGGDILHHDEYTNHGDAMINVVDILDEFPNSIVILHSLLLRGFEQQVFMN